MNINLVDVINEHSIKAITKRIDSEEYKIYTPELIKKYQDSFKAILKSTDNKTKAKFIMYERIWDW